MTRYLALRFANTWVTTFVAILLVYIGIGALPGDALQARFESSADPAKIEQERDRLGLNEPLIEQLTDNFVRLSRGDLGTSWASGQPVSVIIMQQLGPTLALATSASFFALIVGIALGVLSETRSRRIAVGSNAILLALPITLMGTIVSAFSSEISAMLRLDGSSEFTQVVPPILTIGLSLAGGIASVTSNSLRQVMRQPFMLAARAKGLTRHRAIWSHGLRVGLVSIIELSSLQLGFLISGTMITETLFARPGLGRVLVVGILSNDVPVVQSIVIISVLAYSLTRLLAEVLIVLIDPRVRLPTTSNA